MLLRRSHNLPSSSDTGKEGFVCGKLIYLGLESLAGFAPYGFPSLLLAVVLDFTAESEQPGIYSSHKLWSYRVWALHAASHVCPTWLIQCNCVLDCAREAFFCGSRLRRRTAHSTFDEADALVANNHCVHLVPFLGGQRWK